MKKHLTVCKDCLLKYLVLHNLSPQNIEILSLICISPSYKQGCVFGRGLPQLIRGSHYMYYQFNEMAIFSPEKIKLKCKLNKQDKKVLT